MQSEREFQFKYVIVGVIAGILFLLTASTCCAGTSFQIYSLGLFPEPTLTVAGFHMHHWIIGGILVGVGLWVRGRLGSVVLGTGVLLLLDDLPDLIQLFVPA